MAGKNRFLVVMAHNLTPGLEAILVRVAQRNGFATIRRLTSFQERRYCEKIFQNGFGWRYLYASLEGRCEAQTSRSWSALTLQVVFRLLPCQTGAAGSVIWGDTAIDLPDHFVMSL